MTCPALAWRGLPYERAAFFTKGTELAVALVPGTRSRFAVYETRGGRDADGHPVLVYRLRDAEAVTLADVEAGRRPPVVGTFAEPDEAVAAALRLMT